MKRAHIVRWTVGLFLITATASAGAQIRTVPQFDFDFPDFEAMIPPIPPIPKLPPRPFFQSPFATNDPELRVQQEAFRALLRNNPERALDLAAERLKSDPADPVVVANLSTIANSGSSKAFPLLVSIAKSSASADARRQAVMAISRAGNKDALATLEDIYNSSSSNVEVKRAVISAIGRSNDSRAVSVLAKIAKSDSDSSVRQQAVQQLGNRKEPEAMKALEDLLSSPAKPRG